MAVLKGIDVIRRWVIKTRLKEQAKEGGVAITLPKKEFVDLNTSITADRLLRSGIDIDQLTSPNQIDNLINQINKRSVISQDDPRFKGIMEGLMGKKGEVVDMTGKKIPPGSGIMGGRAVDDIPPPGSRGGKDDIAAPVQSAEEATTNLTDSTIQKMLKMEPIDAMKEANKVIKREGIYKALDKKQAKKILEDTEDHIFERNFKTPDDPDFDPEDMAKGGRVGLKEGDHVRQQKRSYRPEDFNEKLASNYSSSMPSSKMLTKGITSTNPITSPTKKNPFLSSRFAGSIFDFNNIKDEEETENLATGGRVGFFKGAVASGENISPGTDTKGNVRDDNPFTGGGGNNNNQTSTTPTISSPTESPFTRSTMPPSGLVSTLSPSILARIARMSKGLKPVLGKDLGLEYENIDDLNDVLTNFKITQDIEDLIKTRKINPELKYKKEIGDNTFFDVGINKEGEAKLQFLKKFEKGGIARIGLKDGMNRRTFLKYLAGFASIPIVGKIVKPLKIGKTVSKVPIIKTGDVAGKPEWFDQLVNKVIIEGDDVTKKFATKDREIVHTKKIDDNNDVTIYQDLDEGTIRVDYDSPANMGEDTVSLQFKPGMMDESTGKKPKDEFEASELEPRYVGGPEDADIEFDGLGGGSSIKMLESDVSKLKEYATGQKPTMKEFVESKKRKDRVKAINEDTMEQAEYISGKYGDGPEPDFDDIEDFARGGIARMLGE